MRVLPENLLNCLCQVLRAGGRSDKARARRAMKKAGVPVLPVYIDGSFAALAKGAKCIKPVKITVYYGRLITPAEFQQLGSGRETYQKAAELVMARIAALKPGSQNKA